MRRIPIIPLAVALIASSIGASRAAGPAFPDTAILFPGETHFARVRQLTFGGENAEAYFSGDGKRLSFQSTRNGGGCDQIYTMKSDGSGAERVSNGRGRCTCAFLSPDGKRLIYASTFEAADTCPPRPDFSHGYVWAVYNTFKIYSARPDGSDLKMISGPPGYNAECVYSPDGGTILFTSDRQGDLDLYTMKPDGSNVRRITRQLGYDGGGFFSPDGRRIVFRAHHYADTASAEALEYRGLLGQHLVHPSQMEIFVCDADGSNLVQVTHNGAANFAPFFHPDGRRIVFSSNMADPKGRDFDLYLIHDDGTAQERLTFCPEFDAFPMFSPDGRTLVWASNRNAARPHETNIFIAEWQE